jgi:hypothetical protein
MVGRTWSSASPKGERVNKTIRLVTLLLAALALVLSAGALPAAAAPGNTFPGGSTYIDNQTHSISPNTPLWYRFDYAGDRSVITLTLVNGTKSGVGFNVFTPAQIGDWWSETPIGRGTPQALNCSSGMPETGGACQASDLTWVGNFPEGGTYYVEAVDNNMSNANFQLTIAGSGVTVNPQMSAATATMSGGTTATTTNPAVAAPNMMNVDPGHATVMDNNSHMIPSSTGLWYRFAYAVNHSQVTITMPNGANSGLEFSVFAPGQIGDWWDETPVGRGTVPAMNCNGIAPGIKGDCQSTNLTWTGNFNTNGWYYVQVFNNNDMPTSAQLMIQGDGVALAQ